MRLIVRMRGAVALTLAVWALAPAAARAAGQELTGWGEPGPAELAALQEVEGENLDAARKAKPAPKIEATKKDLDGDGIAELFFYVRHPMFCEQSECMLIVLHRDTSTGPWREVAVIPTQSTSLLIVPAPGGGFAELHPIALPAWKWNGKNYQREGS